MNEEKVAADTRWYGASALFIAQLDCPTGEFQTTRV